MISLLVLGPVRVYREVLADALDRHEGVRVIGVTASAAEAADRVRGRPPDVVLADASTGAGVHLIQELFRAGVPVRVVALAAPEDEAGVIECARAGVGGFVASEAALREVVAAAHAVVRGEAPCPPRVAATLLRRVSAATPANRDVRAGAGLTAREREILALIDEGLSNKEIASRLFIEVSTVKNHVHNILDKLGARRRSEAAARARAHPRYLRVPG
jgi:DNA-binding NarL/FixJ family response regulator